MLSGLYEAPFDVANSALGLGTLTLSTAGESDIVVTLSTLTSGGYSRFWHYKGDSGNSWLRSVDKRRAFMLTTEAQYSFDVALTTALQAAATTATWPNPSDLTVSFRRENTPIGYRIRYTGSTITAAWSTDAGRALMGFQANVGTPAETLLADAVPTYVIVPNLLFTSDDTMYFEPTGSATHVTPDDNSGGMGWARYMATVYQDWVQQFESKEKVDWMFATAAHPWTFRDLFDYCRGDVPFALCSYRATTLGGTVHMLRMPQWDAPERASSNNDAQFHVAFKTDVIGEMVDVP